MPLGKRRNEAYEHEDEEELDSSSSSSSPPSPSTSAASSETETPPTKSQRQQEDQGENDSGSEDDDDEEENKGDRAGSEVAAGHRAPAAANFEELGLAPWLVGSLSSMALTRPTTIQAACIPEILKGRDCIGGSRTGSGKTVAFATPILHRWAEDPIGIYAVVLTPTRFVLSGFVLLRLASVLDSLN